jgi:short-subunit dehydrogenase
VVLCLSRIKHCYVTGGSAGLGLSLAKLLARKGANVSIVARDKAKLDKALQELEVRGLPSFGGGLCAD